MFIKYNLNTITHIIFVGAGGTGGYLIRDAFRVFSAYPEKMRNIRVYIVDPDIVEYKNILRQNFIPDDIGKPKAQIMAERYGSLFNINVTAMIEKFTDFLPYNAKPLIIDTIDNPKGRVEINHYVQRHPLNSSWISLGNTDKDGQMVIYSGKNMLDNQSLVNDAPNFKPRTVVDLFPNDFTAAAIKKDEEEEARRSCADYAISDPQTIAINLVGANVATSYLYSIFASDNINHDVVFYDRFHKMSSLKLNEPLVKIDESSMDSITANIMKKFKASQYAE